MRIDSDQGSQPLLYSRATSNQTAANGGSSVRAGDSNVLENDHTQLSAVHAQVQALVVQASQLPETSQAKVDALRQAVASGTYHRSPEQIAEALFANFTVGVAA